MEKSTERFTGKADIYGKYRPSYPAALYDWLYNDIGMSPDSAIADIGAGTGLFTAPLAARGSTVYAVEPNADMRAKMARALGEYANLRLVDAPAEHTGLPDASLDLVTVAQAFHWFDADDFRTECQRILKPDGLVLLVWNLRDLDSPPARATEDVKDAHCPAYEGRGGGQTARDPEKFKAFFHGGAYATRVFDNPMTYDRAAYLGMSLSTSYAPAEGDPRRAAYLAALESVFAAYAVDGRLNIPTAAHVFIGRV